MRYILIILGVIAAFIILVVLVVTLRPSGNSQTRTNTPVPKMADLASSSSVVRFTSDGPINALENHRSIRIMIDEHKRAIDILTGYSGTVLATETFDNDKDSYQSFLAALDRAGFALDRKTKIDSEAGLCPTSSRFVFELYNTPNGSSFKPFRHWSTACNQPGSFGGNSGIIKQLFKLQIPNYQEFINRTTGAGNANI